MSALTLCVAPRLEVGKETASFRKQGVGAPGLPEANRGKSSQTRETLEKREQRTPRGCV